ncbi:MAG TPA: CoA pyrophosphatase [Gemmatimonadales bacterium]
MTDLHWPDHLQRRLARPPGRADPTGRHEAAVALVLAAQRYTGPLALFIKRALHPGDPWSGQMALPGGRRDRTDDDLLATAIRETWEETGLVLTAGHVVGELDDLAPQTPVLPPVLVRPFVFRLDDQPPLHTTHEVQSHVWFPLDELRATERHSVVRVRGADLTVPAYLVGGELVWGMTYRIVSSIFDEQ